MPFLNIKNNTGKTIYAFQYVKWQYDIGDYLVDAVSFYDGVGELREALVAVEDLPETISTIEDAFKYFSYLKKIYDKSVKVKGDADQIANKVFTNFAKNAVAIPQGASVDILKAGDLTYLTPTGIQELFGAPVITVSLMGQQGALGLQYQSAVDQSWTVTDAGVQNTASNVSYVWHGDDEHLPTIRRWRPAMAVYNDQLYLVGRGAGDSIWWTAYNGKSWSYPIHVEGIQTSGGVSLAPFDGYLYAGWLGTENFGLKISRFDGANWEWVGYIPNAGSTNTPSLVPTSTAQNADALRAYWRGIGDNGKIWTSFYHNDITNWAPQQMIGGVGTSEAPAVCATKIGGDTVMAWKGFGDDTGIWYNTTDQPAQNQIKDASTSDAPSIASWPFPKSYNVVIAYKGGTDTQIYTRYSLYWGGNRQPLNWGAASKIPNAHSLDGPAISYFNGTIFVAWKDASESHQAMWSTFVSVGDEYQWTDPQSIG